MAFKTSKTQVFPISPVQMWEQLQPEKEGGGGRKGGIETSLLRFTRGVEIHAESGSCFEVSFSGGTNSFGLDALRLAHLSYNF